MMEPTKYKERTKIEDNFNDPRVIYQKEEDDIGFSRLRVIVRRQDCSMEEVYLGMFRNSKQELYV